MSQTLSFSGLTLKQAMQLIPAEDFQKWSLQAPPRPPSDVLVQNLWRLDSFELSGSEAAKVLLIDILLSEIVPDYPRLKIWKSASLDSDTVAGVADYLIAPRRAYLETPLLCAIEAKRDDFDAGQVQCVAEMAICQQNNRRDGHDIDIYGVVSNGQGWVFYRLTPQGEIYESGLFSSDDLPRLLGVLNAVCAACDSNAP